MKIHHTTNRIVWILTLGIIFFSCEKPNDTPDNNSTYDIWVLNEGVWNMNNSSITAYNTITKDKIRDIYKHANHNRSLGDVANDMIIYGSKVYIVVNVSNLIDVLDKNTGASIKQIKRADIQQPRCITSHNGKVYACYFDGSVVKIDTLSLEIEATAQAGRNPDGICIANNKLYVSNSGGLDYPNYDNTVSVFDLNLFSEIKKITVGMNPKEIKADQNGNVYVVCNGNYDDIAPCLQRINSNSDAVEKTFDLEVVNFDFYNNSMYFYTYDYATSTASYRILDLLNDHITNTNFISGNSLPQTPYGININPYTGDIYLTDALDYTSMGDVHCYGSDGKKKFQFEAGLLPKKVVFK